MYRHVITCLSTPKCENRYSTIHRIQQSTLKQKLVLNIVPQSGAGCLPYRTLRFACSNWTRVRFYSRWSHSSSSRSSSKWSLVRFSCSEKAIWNLDLTCLTGYDPVMRCVWSAKWAGGELKCGIFLAHSVNVRCFPISIFSTNKPIPENVTNRPTAEVVQSSSQIGQIKKICSLYLRLIYFI